MEAEKGDSEKISFADALFMDPQTKTYPKIFGRTEDREKLQKIKKQKGIRFSSIKELRKSIENARI